MLTETRAQAVRYGQTLYHLTDRNANGTPRRFRVSGKCQTWKMRPGEFRLPVKFGWRGYTAITPHSAWGFTTDEDEAKSSKTYEQGSILSGFIRSHQYREDDNALIVTFARVGLDNCWFFVVRNGGMEITVYNGLYANSSIRKTQLIIMLSEVNEIQREAHLTEAGHDEDAKPQVSENSVGATPK